jgi:signal peptidase I
MISLNQDEFTELALQILDDGNSLRFRAHGESMNPFIRNGDILEVQPVSGDTCRRGDVLLCKFEGQRIVAHRVISIQGGKGQRSLVMKGDSALCKDGITNYEQVLGRVVSLEREGKEIRIDSTKHRLSALVWNYLAPYSYRLYWKLNSIRRKLNIFSAAGG